MHRLAKALACAGLLLLSSCAMLDKEIPLFDQETGEQVGTTTVGDAIADSGEAAGEVASGVVGMLTGNPILGGAAAAAAAGLFAGARRKKKQPQAEAEQ
jgi:hypothetical protein